MEAATRIARNFCLMCLFLLYVQNCFDTVEVSGNRAVR